MNLALRHALPRVPDLLAYFVFTSFHPAPFFGIDYINPNPATNDRMLQRHGQQKKPKTGSGFSGLI
ncbi:MAG: hypothetical protein AAGA50_24795 [Pseudomonadota bacterium]